MIIKITTNRDDKKFFIQELFSNGTDWVVEWAIDETKRMSRIPYQISIAIESGAAESGRLDLLQSYPYKHLKNPSICDLAAKSGHFELLKWARQQGYRWTSKTCTNAAFANRFDILQWARENGCKWSEHTPAAAALVGNLEMLRWVIQHGCFLSCYSVATAATSIGSLPMLEYLDQLYPGRFSLRSAGSSGHMHVIEWAKARGYSLKYVWLGAAEAGRLDILQWLKENRVPLYSSYHPESPYAQAAIHGHLHVLKWLKENGYPWTSDLTFTDVAAKGHLEVLKWLRENDGPKGQVCEFAALKGHLHILQWAIKNGYSLYRQVCSCAAKRGHLNILKWARENGCDWDQDTCREAAINGHVNLLDWAYDNGCPFTRKHCLQSAPPSVQKWYKNKKNKR